MNQLSQFLFEIVRMDGTNRSNGWNEDYTYQCVATGDRYIHDQKEKERSPQHDVAGIRIVGRGATAFIQGSCKFENENE